MRQRKTSTQVDDENRRHCVVAARRAIYEKNYAVNSKTVNRLLQEDSLVPTKVRSSNVQVISTLNNNFQNAFSRKLSQFGFNFFNMLVVDLMHEVEIGVWKAIFIHLLHILDSQDESLKHELDRWYVLQNSFFLSC